MEPKTEAPKMEPRTEALIDRRVLAVSLRALAVSKGGTVIGNGDELCAALRASLTDAGRHDPAMPTCGLHLNHLLRELAGLRAPFAGLEVRAIANGGGWCLRAVAA